MLIGPDEIVALVDKIAALINQGIHSVLIKLSSPRIWLFSWPEIPTRNLLSCDQKFQPETYFLLNHSKLLPTPEEMDKNGAIETAYVNICIFSPIKFVRSHIGGSVISSMSLQAFWSSLDWQESNIWLTSPSPWRERGAPPAITQKFSNADVWRWPNICAVSKMIVCAAQSRVLLSMW